MHDLWQEDPDCRYNYFSALTPILQWNIKQGYKFTLFPEVFSVNDLFRYIKYFLTARSHEGLAEDIGPNFVEPLY